jgi:hypothetical protein
MDSQFEIVAKLRRYKAAAHSDIQQAADMLEFLLAQFQVTDCKMDGNHGWRFRHGWPMTHCKGQTIETAIRAAMAEQERGRISDPAILQEVKQA